VSCDTKFFAFLISSAKNRHVAGSKGKGSTATVIASMLQATGLSVGVYSSPHLTRIEERIAIDGQPCDPARFAELVRRLMPVVAQMDAEAQLDGTGRGPTFFEIITAVAWLQFVESRVAVAVMEVGLGGRLDSNNVCTPTVSVITSISLDHTRQSGSTHEQIAAEKAGIIKRNVPVVSGVTHPAAQQTIERVAAQQKCDVISVDRDFHYEVVDSPLDLNREYIGTPFHYHDAFGQRFEALTPAMLGEHQAANAAVAIAAVTVLGKRRTADPRVPRLPARIEVLSARGALVGREVGRIELQQLLRN
jgi:dihydrofolate synthase/folylpolyglutamate synthase